MSSPTPKRKSSANASAASSGTPQPAAAAKLSRFQKFTPFRIHRSELKNAPYNPRKIDSYGRAKLERNLKKVGLLTAVTWNEVTGNLVAGHQRLAILDALEGSPDYLLDVAKVHLTPKQEREQNLAMNNPSVGGGWDMDLLAPMFQEADPDLKLDLEATGFDAMELEMLLGDSGMFSAAGQGPEVEAMLGAVADVAARPPAPPAATAGGTPESATPAANGGEAGTAAPKVDVEAMKQHRAAERERYAQLEDTENYAVLVFGYREDREAFMRFLGVASDERYVDGRAVAQKLGIEPAKRVQA